jgi:uncharacterized damage-inducible protein DinB
MIGQSLLPELDRELANSRAMLELVPEANAKFKPHEKSSELGKLAMHVANLPHWVALTFAGTEFETNPEGGIVRPTFTTTAALLDFFDGHAREAREALANATDDQFEVPWTLLNRGTKVFTMPRRDVLRFFVMNHMIHHRGQLSVYLRLNDVKLPPIYGPTADM